MGQHDDTPDFDGHTYESEHDHERLASHLKTIRGLVSDGQWHTPDEITAATGYHQTAGITARIRDLRKPKFGGHTVECRRVGNPRNGVWEYRLILNPESINELTRNR
jgi:hypothetical protein